jgi:hypothetical protein
MGLSQADVGGGPAQRCAGEDRAGVVVAGVDDGFVAMGWTNAGEGALYARDPGGEPHEPDTRQEAGKNKATPFVNGKDGMKNQNCHFYRTPFTDPFKASCKCQLQELEFLAAKLEIRENVLHPQGRKWAKQRFDPFDRSESK